MITPKIRYYTIVWEISNFLFSKGALSRSYLFILFNDRGTCLYLINIPIWWVPNVKIKENPINLI